MRSPALTKLYRRLIVKHFGSTKNFLIWTGAVILTIYFIDTYILTRDRLQSLVAREKEEIKKIEQIVQNDKLLLSDEKKEDLKQKSEDEAQNNKEEKPPDKGTDGKPSDAKDGKTDEKSRCGLKEECPKGKYSYHVKSGVGRDTSPIICFNGHYAMSPEKNNGKRGINMVIINDKSLAVEDVRNFDTYQEDDVLIRYLKLGVADNHIVLAATQDEAAFHLSDSGRSWLHQYGSAMIDKLKFRDNLVMVGQKGLTRGSAIEKHQPRSGEFAENVEMSGCLSIPMGKLGKFPDELLVSENGKEQDVKAVDLQQVPASLKPGIPKTTPVGKLNKLSANGEAELGVKAGEELPDCGVKQACGSSSFPVHLFTGRENVEGPKICVSGKYVLAKNLNDGGRGFNIVIVDPKTKDVVRVGHFDTYAEDSSNLEIFLEMMNEKEIMLAVTHDDASKNLNLHAQKVMESLGSSLITKLSFRDIWAFVGQRGLAKGLHSEIEEIEFAGSGKWPRPIDKKLCVPTELKGSKIKPDPLANKNVKRREFCAKYDGYGSFCEEQVDEALTPAPLSDKSLENHPIFQVPIILVPGLNHNAVRMQLETVMMNPGVKPDMITVMYDEKFEEPAALAEVFSVKSAKLEGSTKYVFQMQKALEKVWELYPTAKHVIVLEEEVILSQDFLYFLAQCLSSAEADQSLAGISAWNPNGYKGLSTLANQAYRIDSLPGVGFLLKKSFYDSHMKGKMDQCCLKRFWDTWFPDNKDKEMIIPDVSRVYRKAYEGLSEQADFLQELFNRERITNLDSSAKIQNVDTLTADKYEVELDQLFKGGIALDTANVDDCLAERGLGFYIPESGGKTFVIFFEQADTNDYKILESLCKCFKLFHSPGHKPRGLHKGFLRFSYKSNHMMLVGSSTPYYKYMPSGYKPIKLSQLKTS